MRIKRSEKTSKRRKKKNLKYSCVLGITVLHLLRLVSEKFYTQSLKFVFSEIRRRLEGDPNETYSLLVSRATQKAPRMIRCTYVG